jgi:uncharacterized protein DUF4012
VTTVDDQPDPYAGPGWSSRPHRPGVIRKRRKKRRWRRRVLLGSGVFVLALLAGAAWLVYDGLHARSELTAVQAEVRTLRAQVSAGDLDGARATARELRSNADAARGHTTSPVWMLAEHLPSFGSSLHDARSLTATVAMIADRALPQLIDATTVLDPKRLRGADGDIDVASIQRLGPALDQAGRTLGTAITSLDRLPRSDWASINVARARLLDQLPSLRQTVSSAGLAARLVPNLLGAGGPRNYMITFENEAEMRATGGLPGAFAIMHADRGALTFTHFEPDNYLIGTTAEGVHFGGDYNDLYGTGRYGATSEYLNTNLSPHYPYAAQLWTAMWRHKTGQQLDGAFVIDPTALSYLLQVSGPVLLADGTSVTAANVVALTQATVYANFAVSENDARKDYLLQIAKAVSHKLLSGGVDTAGLVRAAGRAADESRLLLWVRDPGIERQLARLPIGGVEPQTTAPYFRLTLWNSTASKLDYYVHASVDWTRTGCGAKRAVTVTVQLTNAAPEGLPAYVLGPTTDKQYGIAPGDEYLAILGYGTQGAELKSYTVNGKETDVAQLSERGHPVFSDGEYVPRGKTITIVYHLIEPAGSGAPIVPAQPMVNPMTVTVHDAHCP